MNEGYRLKAVINCGNFFNNLKTQIISVLQYNYYYLLINTDKW